MTALMIEDIRQFTSKLFVGEAFDHFLVREAKIVTYNSFTIDGRIRSGYFSEEEAEEKKLGELSSWGMVKPICFSLIKGKKLPGSFHIDLQLPPAGTAHFLSDRSLPYQPETVKGLNLNIRYEEGKLMCVTGTSVSFFTMDKALDGEWDTAVKGFLKKHEIVFEEA